MDGVDDLQRKFPETSVGNSFLRALHCFIVEYHSKGVCVCVCLSVCTWRIVGIVTSGEVVQG